MPCRPGSADASCGDDVMGRTTTFPSHRTVAGPWIGAAVIAVAIAWSFQGTGINPVTLLDRAAVAEMATYARKLFPPDLSAGMLREAATGAAETFAISVVGTT